MKKNKSLRFVLDILVIPLFFLGLWSPLGENLLGWDPTAPPKEKRVLASAPALEWNLESIQAFPRSFENFYNDHFGWRSSLIHWNNYLRVAWLGSSSPRVIVGAHGWLYYGTQRCRESYRNINLFSDEALAGLQEELEKTQQWRVQRNILYLNVWVPNKDTIYPEFLPSWMVKVNEESRLDQWIEWMTTHTSIPVLDLRPALFEAKRDGLIYFRTDSHWNDVGSYIAYREIMKTVAPWFDSLTEIDPGRIDIHTAKSSGGDLAGMLDMQKYYDHEYRTADIVKPQAKKVVFDRTSTSLAQDVRVTAMELPGSTAPSLMVFHDSFGIFLIPYFSETFSRVVFVESLFNQVAVEMEHPDLVLDVHVERLLTPGAL